MLSRSSWLGLAMGKIHAWSGRSVLDYQAMLQLMICLLALLARSSNHACSFLNLYQISSVSCSESWPRYTCKSMVRGTNIACLIEVGGRRVYQFVFKGSNLSLLPAPPPTSCPFSLPNCLHCWLQPWHQMKKQWLYKDLFNQLSPLCEVKFLE